MLLGSLNLQRGGAVAQLGARLDGNLGSPQNQLPAIGISV